ncbi:GIY-YIG nuclease family protein [Kiloniella laminariae]|uniref:GIY-YIG nuclease family protein n=1 Tax=Kiloniella laminariae TaxID=454162 RepID=UPI00037344A8|nr:GIY-YIG nuclease family protein [Kiloniella laminariae]
MAKEFTDEDDALLAELGVEVESKKAPARSPREERVIAGFEEIQRFVEQQGRAPQHGENRDIFERLYATRLERLRVLPDCKALIEPLDHQGLLTADPGFDVARLDQMDDDALLAELEVAADTGLSGSNKTSDKTSDITNLRHVRSSAEKRAAEEIANRESCADFETFRPLFARVQQELKDEIRSTRKFVKDTGFLKADIKQGEFFILGGQTAYVAELGETLKAPNGETDARLRVIFSNGTESNLLLRSLQRALYKDEAGRRITSPTAGPLFTNQSTDDDEASGTIYVLRSKSQHPVVTANREVLHKIGVTSGKLERRFTNAKLDPTFLMADVEIVASYELYNINRTRLEKLIHRVFETARLDIEIRDRFDKPVTPREWFLVPLFVIDEAVEKIRDETIGDYRYDLETASLKKRV